MWPQNYTPVGGSLPLSALVAAIPIFTLLVLLGVMRKPAWMASLAGLCAAAVGGRGRLRHARRAGRRRHHLRRGVRPVPDRLGGLRAILLYRVTVESGKFELLKDSIGHLTGDPRLQALLIAFAFGAFIEGASGFGTPVAVAAAMLAGLGFSPFYAAGICLLANTAPVAFGSIGIPISHAGRDHGPAARTAERRGGPDLRAHLADRAGLSVVVMSRLEGLARRAACRRGVRRRVRGHAVPGFELHRRAAHRHPGIHGRDGRAGRDHHLEARSGRACAVAPQLRVRSRSPGRRTCCWWSSCCCGATSPCSSG